MLNRFFLLTSKKIPYDPVKAVTKLAEYKFIFPESAGDFYTTANYNFPSSEDGNPVVLTYDNFTVNTGHTVTVSKRCKGLYLYIKGDLTVNGTLSMTARGAKAAGRYVVTDWKADQKYVAFFLPTFDVNKLLSVFNKNQIIYPTGGVSNGAIGVNGACGAGKQGYRSLTTGGNGTSFSGGAGGGAASSASSTVASNNNGQPNGGSGGIGISAGSGYTGGGGAGNPGAGSTQHTTASTTGSSGTGGLLILIVDGNIVINGSIQSNGSAGGSGGGTVGWTHLVGGGSGGGAIHIFNKNRFTHTFINTNKITVTGGDRGEGGTGNGSINVVYTGEFEETLVGKWIDDKPIYKTRLIINNNNLQSNWVQNKLDISQLDYETFVNITGTMQCKSETHDSNTEHFKVYTINNAPELRISTNLSNFNSNDRTIIDFYYTKKSDNNVYNGDNIYSLEETLIGTTINDEPVYRKVVELVDATATNTTYQTDISNINISKIINFYGIYNFNNSAKTSTVINYYNNGRIWLNIDLKKINNFIISSDWASINKNGYAILEYTKGED